MRLKHFVSVFLALLFLGVGQVWGTSPATLSFTSACGGSGTDSDGNSWTVSSDAAESTYDANKGVHYGTGKAAVSSLSLSTSGISGTITQIKVNASGASSTTAKLNVTVGGNAFGSEQSLTSIATTYTLTGSASGEIVISITQSSAKKALYCKSVEVTYTTGGGQQTPVLEGLTISEAPTNTTYEAGNAFDPTGLVVTGTYSQGDPQIISSGITWTACKTQNGTYVALDNEDVALAANETGIYVRATVGEVTSTEFYVTDLNVTPAKPKSTLIFTAKCNGSGTADDGVTWTVISDASAESTFDDARGIHYGTNSDAVTYIQLESAAFTDKITKIEVEASGNNNPTLAVAVGETPFGSVVTNLTTTNTKYTFEPTQAQSTTNFTGSVLVLLIKDNKAQKALYIKSIVITYEETPKHELTFGVKEGDGSKGSVTASVGGSTISTGADVTEGATVTLSPSANQYYQVKSVEVLDGNADEVTVTANAGVYTFAMPTSDTEAEVSFEYIPVTSVSVDQTLELVEGESHILSATVLPATALGTVTWASDNENVATVVETTGKVTAVAEGTANITATSTVTGSKYGTCAVTVSAPTGNPITISQTTGGTVAANVDVADVLEGVSVTLTATPTAGYSVSGWTIVGVDAGDLTISIDKTTCSFAMPDGVVSAEASFTHETATLKLVELGVENTYDSENTHYWKESVTLPGLSGLGCSDKVFRGWSADANCTTEPTLKAGDSYEIPNKGENKLYAVFATEVEGDLETWQITNSDLEILDNSQSSTYNKYKGDQSKGGITFNITDVMPATGATNDGKIQLKANAGIIYNKTAFDADIVSIVVTDVNVGVFEGESEISSTPSSGAISATGSGPYTYTFSSGKRYFHLIKNSSNAGYVTSITVNLKGESSYSAYTTSCTAQLPVLDAPTFSAANNSVFYESTDITISAATGASIYYTTDGTTPSSTNGTLYEGTTITLNAYGTYNFKAIAVQADHEDSQVAEATYYFGKEFASVSELYIYLSDNSLTSLNNVKVTGVVSRITAAWDETKGYLTYYISDNGQTTNDLQMYRGAGTDAAILAEGDQVTVTGNYTLYQSTTHEFGAGNTIVARTAATVESVAIGGAAEKTTYSPEDNQFSHTGLTATATYNTGYTKDVTALATWTNNLENNTVTPSGNVEVTATYEGKSDTKEVAVTYTTKTLDHITLSYTTVTTYVGKALPTPTVTASYVEDIDDEDVTESVAAAESPYGFDTEGAYDGNTAGTYTINVSYHLGEVTKSAEYTVTVKAIYNTESEPHTVAEALDIIGANFSTTTSTDSIVVAGIVSRLDGTYVNTYWISDDGNTNNELEVYSGKYLNKVAFTAANQLHVGDVVIVKGKVKTYQSTKEFDSNSRLISVVREPEFAIADIVAGDEFEANFSEDMVVVPTVNSGDAEFTLTSGNEAIVTIVEGKLHAVAEGDAVITAIREATENANALNYSAKEITFNVHVIAKRTRYTVTFDANGGQGTDPDAIANQLAGATVDMPTSNHYSNGAKAFDDWKVINLSNSEEIEVVNDQFVMPAANVKIQAQWKEAEPCIISFLIGGQEVAKETAPQDADYNISQVGAPVLGFTFLGWSETEYDDEVETAPTLINVYHAQAGEETKTLYGIYSRLDDSDPNYGKYVKATAVAEGDYLIVCQSQGVAFDGSLATLDAAYNNQAVTISDGVLELANADDYVFTIAEMTGGYSIQAANGKYIGFASNDNGLTESASALVNTISISNGNADIVGSGNAHLRYNKASNQARFRYFKTTSYAGQEAIQLYKKNVGATVYTSSPEVTYKTERSSLEENRYYTSCLARKVVAVKGATCWNMTQRNVAGTMAFLEEMTLPIEAGTPFIFQATADKFEVIYEGDVVTTAGSNGALRGTLVNMDQDAINDASNDNSNSDIYILSNNTLYKANGQEGNSIGANRAYIVYDELNIADVYVPAPGRRYVTMQIGNVQTPTALEETAIKAENAKFILNGQLYILRDGKLYNAQGQLVK